MEKTSLTDVLAELKAVADDLDRPAYAQGAFQHPLSARLRAVAAQLRTENEQLIAVIRGIRAVTDGVLEKHPGRPSQ